MTRKPPRSLDMRDIMSYCGRNTATSGSSNNGSATEDSEKAAVLTVPVPASDPPVQVKESTTSTPATAGRVTLLSPRKPVDIRSLYRTKTLVNASTQNQATLDEVQLRRKRKINFLEKALYEYISRSQFHHKNKGRLDVDHLREVAINLRDILKIENFFPDRTWFNHFKSHYNFSFSQGVPVIGRRVPLSLDLRDIVSYCGRHEQREQPLGSITLTPKETESARFVHLPIVDSKAQAEKESATKSIEVIDDDDEVDDADDDDDDCVAIEVPTELIEIKDDDEEQEKSTLPAKRNDLKRALPAVANAATPSSPLKIKKIESLNSGVLGTTSYNMELPRCVRSYEDALRLLKPLEDFALLEENYRAIGLLTQLEKVFEGGIRNAQIGDASK